jgi:peptidoglycan/xylan/chitin deacetylase (PgdA/CDA1 family)
VKIGPWSVNRWKIKRALLRTASSVPRDPNGRVGRRIAVLCYHSIHPTRWIASANPELFEAHLTWLAENCTCVHFRDIPRFVREGSPGRPVVAITFDDGYDDNHDFALPLLDRFGLPATFFITPGFIENDPEVVAKFEKALRSRDRDFRPMSWSQVTELRDAGMEIGAHTYSHPNLSLLPASRVTWELAHSKEVLERELGEEVGSLAYPFGKPRRHITDETLSIAAATGYQQAGVVLHRGVRRSDPMMRIPRFNIVKDSVDEVRARVWGNLDIVGIAQAWSPRWLAELVSPEDFRFEA